ncbi:MAG TPA: exosome complex RNA-binding protein Csl4 [Candidatus Norongarragalinales archaeon]|nr:exosome complex RNA-binding protein Csl4 [Candidatus Norongarragalinales archaeon]
MSDQTVAIPGHLLGAVEEFEPGPGAYEEYGQVYSSIIGTPAHREHQMHVESPTRTEKLKKGEPVYAIVRNLYDSIALLEFQPLKRRAAYSTYSYMRISEVAKGYTPNLRDALRIGDLVKAEVVDIKPLGIYLSMAANHLGVVVGFCSHCRSVLRRGTCTRCGANERRKWAQDTKE